MGPSLWGRLRAFFQLGSSRIHLWPSRCSFKFSLPATVGVAPLRPCLGGVRRGVAGLPRAEEEGGRTEPVRWRRSACPAGTSGAWPRAALLAAPTRWTCSRCVGDPPRKGRRKDRLGSREVHPRSPLPELPRAAPGLLARAPAHVPGSRALDAGCPLCGQQRWAACSERTAATGA